MGALLPSLDVHSPLWIFRREKKKNQNPTANQTNTIICYLFVCFVFVAKEWCSFCCCFVLAFLYFFSLQFIRETCNFCWYVFLIQLRTVQIAHGTEKGEKKKHRTKQLKWVGTIFHQLNGVSHEIHRVLFILRMHWSVSFRWIVCVCVCVWPVAVYYTELNLTAVHCSFSQIAFIFHIHLNLQWHRKVRSHICVCACMCVLSLSIKRPKSKIIYVQANPLFQWNGFFSVSFVVAISAMQSRTVYSFSFLSSYSSLWNGIACNWNGIWI